MCNKAGKEQDAEVKTPIDRPYRYHRGFGFLVVYQVGIDNLLDAC